MSAPASTSKIVQFGVFELDLQRAELRKQGIRVKLQEQPLKVLQLLLENPGQIVSREQIRTRIWAANTFVEFDQGLYSAMTRLRDTLGDSSDSPRFIETVARRGYRFIAPVSQSAIAAAGQIGPKTKGHSLEVQPQAIRRWISSLLAGLLGGALLLTLVFEFNFAGAREWLRSRTTPIRSIAVLPLENLSADPEQDYFADGMTDELITSLARLGTLRVVSRTSVMRYKKTSKTLPQIGQELNVDGIVEGTVERSGNRVRIRIQLIQASSDRHLWAQSYDRELGDTLALQTEAARDIVEEIQPSLTSAKQQGSVVPRRVNPDAYEAYLKGLYFSNKRSPESFKRALEYFHEAIAKDPDFAAAYSGLSDALIGQIFTGTPSSEVRDKATQAAEKSIELDPALAEAHDSLGIIREIYDWDWAGAESEYRRAIELTRNFAHAHQDYALFLMTQGRFDQSMEEAQRAQNLDPLSPFIRTTYCLGLSIARRYEQAAQKCQEALELDPNFLHAHGNLAGIYVAMGLPERGVDEYQKAASLRGTNPTEVADTQKIFQKGGMRALWRKWLKPGPAATGRDDPMEVAALYSLLNEKDHTFAWLEKAYQQRSPLMEFLKEDPDFDNVRSDPRYSELLRKVGLDK